MHNFKRRLAKEKDMLIKSFEQVLESGWYILGEKVQLFEQAFAQYTESKYCVGVANGLEALQIALLSAGVKAGDEVITTPLSAYATTLAIIHVGAVPVLVDITPETLNLNPDLIESAITTKTKAVLPVHLYGNPCRADLILDLCKKNNVILIEDACQAHGATFRGKKVGTFGKLGCFSFYPTKNLGALGDGGAIVCQEEELYKKAKDLRDYGQSNKYVHIYNGLNSRLDELQAAFLLERLKHLADMNDKRRQIASIYLRDMTNPKTTPLIVTEHAESAYHLFVIKTGSRSERELLQTYLKSKGIMTDIHYPYAIHQQKAFHDYLKYQKFSNFPVCEKAVETILSLPIGPELEMQEIEYIVSCLNSF